MYWPLLSFAIQKTFTIHFFTVAVIGAVLRRWLYVCFFTHSMDLDFGQCVNMVWNES
jgi:hypothetical protein